jgi:predicted DCC family thiol-disulfide oxidoreductase YuxK
MISLMKKKKNTTYLIIVLGVIILIALFFIFRQSPPLLFYSDSCPHCQNVEKYISENGVRQKLKFRELEVSQNQTNAQTLERKARGCGLNTDQGVGIPLFFDGQKCYQGDTAIISYFQSLK